MVLVPSNYDVIMCILVVLVPSNYDGHNVHSCGFGPSNYDVIMCIQ